MTRIILTAVVAFAFGVVATDEPAQPKATPAPALASVVEPGNSLESRLQQVEEDNVQDRDITGALMACLRNESYIGVTPGDDRALLVQCVDDWYDANAQGDF